MDPSYEMMIIKEEFQGANDAPSSSSSSPFMLSFSMANNNARTMDSCPRPREGLNETGPPPFLTKTYEIVEDSSCNHIVSWSQSSNSFIVWDPQIFSTTLLPKYFKHNNFSSFVRQLNTYGFRKVDPDRWEFASECFLRGQKHLLNNIRRRKTNIKPQPQRYSQKKQQESQDSCVEVGKFGLDGEINWLKRDKQVLMMELVRLKQEQQNTKACVTLIEEKLKRAETKQQQMMRFLVRAMKNPDFFNQLVQQKAMRKKIEEAIRKKRGKPIDQGPSNVINIDDNDNDDDGDDDNAFGKIHEQETFGGDDDDDMREFDISELDIVAMDIQGLGNSTKEDYANVGTRDQINKLGMYDEEFWEDILSDEYHNNNNKNNVQDAVGALGGHDQEDEDNVDVLAEQLGYLGSSSHDQARLGAPDVNKNIDI